MTDAERWPPYKQVAAEWESYGFTPGCFIEDAVLYELFDINPNEGERARLYLLDQRGKLRDHMLKERRIFLHLRDKGLHWIHPREQARVAAELAIETIQKAIRFSIVVVTYTDRSGLTDSERAEYTDYARHVGGLKQMYSGARKLFRNLLTDGG